jgi:2'-5' RNA ligase
VTEPRTAIALLLEEAAPELAAVRAELDPANAARWPFHLTLLHPFVPRRELDEARVATLVAFCRDRPRLSFDLVGVEVFPGVVAYAAPAPAEPLRQIMRELWARFPETPPYGGAFTEPIPHATLCRLEGSDDGTRLAEIQASVEHLLPVSCKLDAVSLMEEYEPDRWRQLRALPLEGS